MMKGDRSSTTSRSQKKKKPDDEDQQTVDSLVRKPRIRFDRHFPPDIIFEILSRTPFETVDACSCVSKEWRGLVIDKRFTDFYRKKHNFINLHSEKVWLDFSSDQRVITENRNNKKFAGYFLQRHHHRTIFIPLDEKNYDPSVRNWQIPEGKEILASSKHGIVFCCDGGGNYFVGKPAAGKWMPMPKPDDFIHSNGGIVHGIVVLGLSPLWYKAVKLRKPRFHMATVEYLHYQIFDSKLRKWGEVEVFECAETVWLELLKYCPTICVSEFIYWQAYHGHVVAFNGRNDSFTIIDLLTCSDRWIDQIHEFNGHLGIVSENKFEGELELWEMVDDINNTPNWRKRRVGRCEDLNRRTEHNILYAKVQNEIIHYRKCCNYSLRCCQLFPFGL